MRKIDTIAVAPDDRADIPAGLQAGAQVNCDKVQPAILPGLLFPRAKAAGKVSEEKRRAGRRGLS